jgi:hypothetical protein
LELKRKNQWPPKTTGKKKGNKGRTKPINLKPKTIKDLSGSEKKRVKGGGSAGGGVLMSRSLDSNL